MDENTLGERSQQAENINYFACRRTCIVFLRPEDIFASSRRTVKGFRSSHHNWTLSNDPFYRWDILVCCVWFDKRETASTWWISNSSDQLNLRLLRVKVASLLCRDHLKLEEGFHTLRLKVQLVFLLQFSFSVLLNSTKSHSSLPSLPKVRRLENPTPLPPSPLPYIKKLYKDEHELGLDNFTR